MTRYINVSAGGTWGTAATWRTITNTPSMSTTTTANSTLGTSTTIYSSSNTPNTTGTFTAPNTSNQCTGFVVWQNANIAGANIATATYTFILQEYDGVSAWVTKASQAITADKMISNSLAKNFFRIAFTTPYTFATTNAGYYRVGITRDATALTTAATFAQESTATYFSYMAMDDRTGVPGDGDQVFIAGYNGTASTVTISANTTIGTFTGTDANVTVSSSTTPQRSYGGAIACCSDGILSLDQTQTITLISKANIYGYNSGTFRDGDGTTALPLAQTHTIQINQNSVNVNYGLMFFNGSTLGFNGIPKTSTSLWKTTYVSGAGTSASHLVVADAVDWAVNDQITFGASPTDLTQSTANIQAKCVTKFIKAKYSSTEYQLSDTAGGAESGLPAWSAGNWSTNTRIVNDTRNIIFTSDSNSYGTYIYSSNGNSTLTGGQTQGQHTFNWCYFKNHSSSKNGFSIFGSLLASVNYCVFDGLATGVGSYFSLAQVIPYAGTTGQRYSFTGLLHIRNANSTYCNSNQRVDYTDCLSIANTGVTACMNIGQTNDFTLTRCIAIGCLSVFGSNLYILNTTFTECEIHACGSASYNPITLNGGAGSTCKFVRCLFGTKGQNYGALSTQQDMYITQYCDSQFIQCTFGSTTPATRVGTSYTTLYNGITTNIFPTVLNGSTYETYTNGGYFQTSGTGSRMSNVSGVTHTAPINFGSKTVAGLPICIYSNLTIQNAAYYAGTHTDPYIQVNYDLGTLTSISGSAIAAENTSAQTISTTFTPTTSNNNIIATIGGKTDAGIPNGDVLWSNIKYTARLYGYQYQAGTYNLTQIQTDPIFIINTPVTDPYITVTNSATVAGYTEFTINHNTKTITITASTTMHRLYDYEKYNLTQNMTVDDWFTTNNGTDFTSTYNFVLNTGVALTGGGSINVGTNTFTKNGTATYDGIIGTSTSRIVHATISNIVAGSRVQIYDTTASTELYNDIVGGTSLDYLFTWTSLNHDIRVRIKYTGASSAYLEYEATGTITNTGFNLIANQVLDTTYATNAIDGSTVTECSVSGATIRIYISDPTNNTITFQRIYNWYQYILFTSSGIANQSSSYFYSVSPVDYKFDPSMKLINQDVANPLTIQGANIAPTSGTDSIIDISNPATMGSVVIYSFFPVDSSGSTALLPTINKMTSLIPACL